MEIALCECGCGLPAPIIRATNRARGYVIGMPHRFVKGHENRGRTASQATRAARSASMKGHPVSDETRKKISEHHKAAGIRPSTEATRKSNINRGLREQNASWKGGRSRMTNGYDAIYAPDHPRAHPNGYVYEHILVAENAMGRPLVPGEVVHHIDRDRRNNRPENLQVFASHSEHMRHHQSLGNGT